VAVVLVGERANGHESPAYDFPSRLRRGAFEWGACRERLLSLGLRWDLALNLLPAQRTREAQWRGPDQLSAQRVARESVRWAREGGHRLVIAGRRACWAYGARWEPLAVGRTSLPAGEVTACVIPHPSGLCRWWNDAENLAAARELFPRLTADGDWDELG
jgi:hypothetical protein